MFPFKKIKIIVLSCLIAGIALSTASCAALSKATPEESTTLETATQETNTSQTNAEIVQTVTQQPTSSESATEDIGGGVMVQQRYRINYYDVPAPFADHVGRERYSAWYQQFIAPYEQDDPDVMVMKQFVQYFKISREDFDKANLEWAKIIRDRLGAVPKLCPGDYWDQETEEIYNGDIIYTFDDAIINEYYLSPQYPFSNVLDYEKALADGEYTSQTGTWVDVAEMEAEILAKYGSLD